ncbi:MAG: hypothetical protein K6E71_07780 [Lachnospiraceae bacterium]|nr:hypothetical protein [Lachnospiraceae bacterium]
MKKREIVFATSLFKTIRFNFHYFGLKGVFRPRVLVARNVRLVKLGGSVEASKTPVAGIKIGFGTIGIIDETCQRSVLEINGKIVFEGRCTLGVNTRIVVGKDGELEFGSNAVMNGGSSVICYRSVRVGEEALVSWECLIMDTDFHSIYASDGKCINENEPIVIGSHVWIGCRTAIHKGAVIPSNCVIASCSKITGVLEQTNCVYANNKIIRAAINWRI